MQRQKGQSERPTGAEIPIETLAAGSIGKQMSFGEAYEYLRKNDYFVAPEGRTSKAEVERADRPHAEMERAERLKAKDDLLNAGRSQLTAAVLQASNLDGGKGEAAIWVVGKAAEYLAKSADTLKAAGAKEYEAVAALAKNPTEFVRRLDEEFRKRKKA
jgi:hypothetical protein